MKILFFLFCCMPLVSALAVTPTSLTVTQDTGAEMYIYNTLNQTMDFEIYGAYAENFTLEENAFKNVEIPPQQENGEIIVKEIYEQGFINAVAIPVNLQQSKTSQTGTTTSLLLTALSLSVVSLLSLGVYGWKKKKKATSI